jgi:hypothetical protein
MEEEETKKRKERTSKAASCSNSHVRSFMWGFKRIYHKSVSTEPQICTLVIPGIPRVWFTTLRNHSPSLLCKLPNMFFWKNIFMLVFYFQRLCYLI